MKNVCSRCGKDFDPKEEHLPMLIRNVKKESDTITSFDVICYDCNITECEDVSEVLKFLQEKLEKIGGDKAVAKAEKMFGKDRVTSALKVINELNQKYELDQHLPG